MAGTSGTPTDYRAPEAAGKPAPPRWWAVALRHGCRYLLAAVFLMAAITKITNLPGFAALVVLRSGLPPDTARLVAAFLPWLELTCAVCLLLGKARREAGLILSLVLVVLLVYSLFHLREPDCGCWVFPRVGTETAWWWPPVRNFGLLLCSVTVAWR